MVCDGTCCLLHSSSSTEAAPQPHSFNTFCFWLLSKTDAYYYLLLPNQQQYASRHMECYMLLTGLHIKLAIHYPKFGYYAVSFMTQEAKSAPGNISVDANHVDGIHYTLTEWKSQKSMACQGRESCWGNY